ncbi:MAG: hypothetical protein IJT68_05690 [Lentisphaeria bacterium]|nr:hypothetical protein [Lentisphaeria bacterium]MBR3506988.1 hypothetical protein [Lentisphaeria bacterium]
MKKLLFTLSVAAAAFCALTFTSCKKNETAGEKLDKAIDKTESGVNKFTKKAEDAAQDTNDAVNKAIDDLQK